MTTVLFSIDGLRPDALLQVDAPHINGLRQRGAWTLQARSVMPCITLVCHLSTFHSVPPTRHGITQNSYQPFARPLPGLVEQIKKADQTAAFFHNWELLRDLARPGNLQHNYFSNTSYDLEHGDHEIAVAAADYIRREQPDFAFVYFGALDVCGHAFGWMSPDYLAQIEQIDREVGLVLDSLPADSAVLLQSDHGGHDRSHGAEIAEDMTIPWIIAGPMIKANYEIQRPVSLLDTAPTLTAVLNIKPAPEWEGCVVQEVFK